MSFNVIYYFDLTTHIFTQFSLQVTTEIAWNHRQQSNSISVDGCCILDETNSVQNSTVLKSQLLLK